MFAVMWILISLVMTALLVGALTTAFTAVHVSGVNGIYGRKVTKLFHIFNEFSYSF